MGKINDRKTVARVLLAILIISVFITVTPTVSATTTYTVHPTDPGADFTTIQDAIDNASAGDSIEVWNSTYHEHVTVNKQLNIYSRDGADVTIVDGSGSDKCFYVTANNVTISGFTVQNGAYGIYLYDSDNSIITENTVNFNKYDGIRLDYYCDFNEIRNNTANSNERHGIYVGMYDGNNKIIGNTVDSNWEDGIQIYYDNDENEITNNTIEFNDRYGILLGYYCEDNNLTQNNINHNLNYGIHIASARNYISQSNVVNGEHIYHFYKVKGTPADPIIVEDLTLTGIKVINLAKITLYDCRYVTVRNNTLQNSAKGIHISDSIYNKVIDNSISLTDGGIYLYSGSDNEITGNTADVDNGQGIYLDSYSEDNNLTDNTLNSLYSYGLKVDNLRNHISQTNIANGEPIYYFYRVYGTAENPVIVENLTLTGAKVSNLGKITVCDSRYITVRNNILKSGEKGIWVDSSLFVKMVNNSVLDNGYGIYLYNSIDSEIIDSDARDNDYGIYLYDSDRNMIAENTVSFSKYDGICLDYYCSFNEIGNNTVDSNKRRGIYLAGYNANNKLVGNTVNSNWEDGIQIYYDNDENEITNNTIEFNDRYGIHLGYYCEDNNLTQNSINYNLDYGIYVTSARNYISQSNVVNGEHIYHFYKFRGTPADPIIVEDLTLTGTEVINLAKITLCDSRYVIVRNNTLQNSAKGIHISDSIYNEIVNNSISLTDGGIYLYSGSDNEITGNTADVDEEYGIYLDSYSEDNNLTDNTLNSFLSYGLKVDNLRNYISQTNIANYEPIYHFYRVYGTAENPVIVENLTLTGERVSNLGKITICDSRYITVRNNKLQNGEKGIWVDSSQLIKMINNSVSDNGYGIYLYYCNDNEVIDSDARDNDYGIYLYDSDTNMIAENTVSFSKYDGIYLDYYCSFNEIGNNMVSSNKRDGIYLGMYDCNNKIIGNTVSSNWEDGIQIYYDNDENEITNNTIEFNDRYGIQLGYYSEDNNLTQNSINYNLDYGIYMKASNNLIYDNYLNNTKNAYDSGTNHWNITKTAGTNIIGGPYLGGNYWSDYVGNDTDCDGLGDTPYHIPGGSNKDYLPLVTIPGDINRDGKVDHKDLLLLASAYGSEVGDPRYIPEADIDCSGKVDHKDLLILAANYGKEQK